jgi:hypothetical protein
MNTVKVRRARAFSNLVKIGGVAIILEPSGLGKVLISQIQIRPYIFDINLKKYIQKLLKDKRYIDVEGEINLKNPRNYSIVVDGIGNNALSNERKVTLTYTFNDNISGGSSAAIWTRPFQSKDAEKLQSYLNKELSYRDNTSNLMIIPVRYELLHLI